MADIFISYASEDAKRVRPLAEALQERGFKVWWDRSLAAGQDYASIIERELRAAKAVIVVWTQSSALSTFVRDEAGRARDEGRLVPVLFDRVEIPLGFGAFQAEDFTRWNGGSNAPQMQILEEALKAKIEGRDADGGAIARKRRKLMARVRLVSVLTVVALIIGIAAGGRYIFTPQAPPAATQEDLRAELLRLLAEGKLTPEQAIELATILEAGALGETQEVNLQGEGSAPSASETELAGISEAEFDQTARETYRQAFMALAQHPDASVRLATVQMSQDSARPAAMQTLWTYAQNNPDDPLRDEIYLLCGSVGEANADPLGQRALEAATSLEPRNTQVWRMLSRSYDRTNRDVEAAAVAQVSEAVELQNEGHAAEAEQRLQQALPQLTAPQLRAPVASELGRIAEQRGDFAAASARYSEAYASRERVAEAAPNSTAAAVLDADAQQLVRALDRSGRTREACERLRQAQEAHDVAAPDAQLLERCQQQFHVPLRTRVELAPQLRVQQQAPPDAAQQRVVAPSP
ncbi:MAG TPA: TIR domain-containing protein [Vitreimonas sp.]|uniref:TIR domain-containing protein n=1 Tax=Vitreimonas sp. TaxID=3069702 RepID=UPI002D6B2E5B|nr:TIR domain-containing protein [Vitreimonas sp.]HYD87190.1 TIR domain-containing protein [Vitreimonas sp.]